MATTERPTSKPPLSSSDSDERPSSPDPSPDPSSLPQVLKSRKSEYLRQRSVRIKVGTWNVAAIPGTEEDVGTWFVQCRGICEQLSGLTVSNPDGERDGKTHVSGRGSAHPPEPAPEDVGLFVLGLQEIVDVSSPAEALRPYVDQGPASRWKAAVQEALPPGYKLVAETQLVGLLQLIYAAPSLADSVSSVSCVNVGTGLLGYMGNKGAVATRLTLGETTCLVFVNCHLAAGSDKGSLERRNWDAAQIATRARFDPIDSSRSLRDGPAETIGQEDFTFWFGDLNYRLEDIPGADVRQVLTRHTENEYDKTHQSSHKTKDPSNAPESVVDEDNSPPTPPSPVEDEDIDPHLDPASLQTTISSLLPHDQLHLQQRNQKCFHEGWREGDISFLPTYKYDVGSVARFDSSEKNRGPSWCDRILYRSHRDMLDHQQSIKEAEDARKRDEEMKARGVDKAVADDSVLFDYDPDVDGADSGDEYDPDKDQPSEDGSLFAPSDDPESDPLRLDYYLSHQGILSSDHKPLVAGFTITFPSVDPQLKAKVHQEVVRELDKAENEARPGLTVVVDHHGAPKGADSDDPNAVNFGHVAFDVPVRRTLVVANTSGVPATFSFEKPERDDGHDHSMPSWIDYRVDSPGHSSSEHKDSEPHDYMLSPGELANIEVTAHVGDIELARMLNDGQITLEEILVLRVASGRDHFISAFGRWLPTCFGRSLEELTVMPEAGARTLPAVKLGDQADHKVPLSAPRELFHLTDAISELTERAVAEWGMTRGESEETPPWFQEPAGFGWPFAPETWTLEDGEERTQLLASAREAMDTNQPFSAVFAPEVSSLHRLEVLSETLLMFLQSLKGGIVTADVWRKLDEQIVAREKSKTPPMSWEESQAWVLENLAYSPAHSVSFTFVTFMLARIANEVAPSSAMLARSAASAAKQQDPSNPDTSTSSTPTTTTTPSTSGTSSAAAAASFIAGSSFRRKRTSTSASQGAVNPLAVRRQAVEAGLSALIAHFLIAAEGTTPSKEKERRAVEDRKRSIIEPFLKTIGVDNNGPSGGVS